MLRYARRRVQCDRSPYLLYRVLVNAVLPHEVTRGVRAVHFEPVTRMLMLRIQADVMKEHADVEQVRVESQILASAGQRAEQERAQRVMKHQLRLRGPDPIGRCPRHRTVGNVDACNAVLHLTSSMSDLL